MVPMFVVGSLVAMAFVVALVAAEVADRRRALRVVADASRFAGPAVDPRLPWL
ncbi:hypothetical protein ABIE44_000757 [Marmoricola sp. OAE513]|uniref:hypothetical protein n=1 Tax=Marmoricola sp. OAE513 TaxID=2817894 RepID=UPI001AE6EC2D